MSAALVVTTKIRQGSPEGSDAKTSRVWHGEAPLPLGHPFSYVLERTPKGVRIRNLATPDHSVQTQSIQELTNEMIEKGTEIKLGDSILVSVRPIVESNPVFETPAEKLEQLTVFTCIGNWILRAGHFEKDFIAEAQGKKYFTATRAGDQLTISVQADGVSAQTEGKAPSPLSNGASLTLNSKDITSTVIRVGSLEWRFTSFAPVTLTPSTGTSKTEVLHDPSDLQRFKKSLISSGVALAGLMILASLWPKVRPENKEELIPPQFTKIVMSQPLKQEKAAASGSPAKGATAPDTAKKADDAKVVQAFRAKALQNAVSGLLKGGMTNLLAQSDFVTGTRASANAKKMFDSKSNDLRPTGPVTGLADGKNVNVASIGGAGGNGMGKGVGYGQGHNANVNGQGKSLVSLDTSASSVEEGLTKDEVGEVIHRHLSEIRYCYESAMIRASDVEGKLMIDFTIGGTGIVKTANIKQSTLPDPRLDDCVLRRLMTWKFPNPKGGVDVSVSYPFIFKTLGR